MVLYLFQIVADHAGVPERCWGINDILYVFCVGEPGCIVSQDGFIEWVIVG